MKRCGNCHNAIFDPGECYGYSGPICNCVCPNPQPIKTNLGGGSMGGVVNDYSNKRLVGLTAEKPWVDLTFDDYPGHEVGNKDFFRGAAWASTKLREKNK